MQNDLVFVCSFTMGKVYLFCFFSQPSKLANLSITGTHVGNNSHVKLVLPLPEVLTLTDYSTIWDPCAAYLCYMYVNWCNKSYGYGDTAQHDKSYAHNVTDTALLLYKYVILPG